MNTHILYFGLITSMLACHGGGEWTETKLSNRLQPISQFDGQQWNEGQVINRLTGNGIAQAHVALIGTQYSTRTDHHGRYRLPSRTGFDWVRVSATGFHDQTTQLGTITGSWPIAVPEHRVEAYIQDRNRPELDSDLSGRSRPEATGTRADFETPHGSIDLWLRRAVKTAYLSRQLSHPRRFAFTDGAPENNSCRGQVDVIPFGGIRKGRCPSRMDSKLDR